MPILVLHMAILEQLQQPITTTILSGLHNKVITLPELKLVLISITALVKLSPIELTPTQSQLLNSDRGISMREKSTFISKRVKPKKKTARMKMKNTNLMKRSENRRMRKKLKTRMTLNAI